MDGDLRCWVRLLPIPILASVPRERAGSSSGILATARLIGQTLGAALVGLMFALTSASLAGIGRSTTGLARGRRIRRGRCCGDQPAAFGVSLVRTGDVVLIKRAGVRS